MFWNTSKTNTFGASTQAARAQSLTTPPTSPENKAKNHSSWNVFRIKMNFLDSKYKWLVNSTLTQHADNEKYYKVLKNIRSHLGFSYPAGVIAQTQACPYAWKEGQKNPPKFIRDKTIFQLWTYSQSFRNNYCLTPRQTLQWLNNSVEGTKIQGQGKKEKKKYWGF